MAADVDNKIIGLVLQILSSDKEILTPDKIRDTVKYVIDMFVDLKRVPYRESVDEELLVKEIEARCDVYVPMISTLSDPQGHEEWFFDYKGEIEWSFWNRYRQYLEQDSKLPPQAILRLHEVSDEILERLENPHRPGPWKRKGMVVGQVQSGKTSNYTALICKAADAGYELIIVLAGIHNSLRSQTQLRLDEGFLGFDTQRRRLFDVSNDRLGVGLLRGIPFYKVNSLTNSADLGDFNLGITRHANITIGGSGPFLLVVKKNVSILKNLKKWVDAQRSNAQNTHPDKPLHRASLLLIDDEADNASININPIFEDGRIDPDLDPSKINGHIRELLNSFEKSAYVAYTATPFANIFIPDQGSHPRYGEDLFPRSFIINLQPPSNYFGPMQLFGSTTDSSADQETPAQSPLIRPVSDHEIWMPDKHKTDHQPGPLPASLQEAIKAFILTCAARIVRGQEEKHNSMLVHVTRFTAVQALVYNQVKEELELIQWRLRYGDGEAARKVIEEFEDLWNKDFQQTIQQFQTMRLTPILWEQVKEVLYKAASKIEIRKINGEAKDTLQYISHPKGLSVICIGGDKLSRGLTLEGLSISYYLRASKMYDTLMQMGRWFGYRPGYIDLCRLYTTRNLINWYRYITTADEELRQMFEDMAAQDRTPADFGLGVKTHPDGLIITAATKMRSGQKVLVSYSKKISETIDFYKDKNINLQNLLSTERLIQSLPDSGSQKALRENYIWSGVDGEAIVDFLANYRTHEKARKAQASILKKYIEARIADKELIEWTVVLISNQENVEKGPSCKIANKTIGLTKRQDLDEGSSDLYRIRRLISPRDEWIDLSSEEIDRALEETQERWKKDPGKSKREIPPALPDGLIVRQKRPATRGLLLLYVLDPDPKSSELPERSEPPMVGFAISFPRSEHEREAGIEYVVNNIYWQQEFGGEM